MCSAHGPRSIFRGADVQSILAIDRRLPPRLRELALATVSVGSPVGILLADASGLVLQQCLFRYHALGAAQAFERSRAALHELKSVLKEVYMHECIPY